LETQLVIAKDLGYLTEPGPIFEQVAEVGRMLSGLIAAIP
jgi:hypothetical protein